MALGKSTRDQVGTKSAGSLPPNIASPNPIRRPMELPEIGPFSYGLGASMYISMNEELYKSYVQVPTNQGQRGGIASRQSMMYQPRNSSSRSQKSEGYTTPLQMFSASNVWETPSGQNTAGVRQSQPSTKFAGPSIPIMTKMPWDL